VVVVVVVVLWLFLRRFCQHKFDVIRSPTTNQKTKTMALIMQQGGHYRGYKDDDLARELMKRFVQAVARAFYDDPKVKLT
jgi:predicted P-loop ATPase